MNCFELLRRKKQGVEAKFAKFFFFPEEFDARIVLAGSNPTQNLFLLISLAQNRSQKFYYYLIEVCLMKRENKSGEVFESRLPRKVHFFSELQIDTGFVSN